MWSKIWNALTGPTARKVLGFIVSAAAAEVERTRNRRPPSPYDDDNQHWGPNGPWQ